MSLRSRLWGLYALLVGANIAAWLWAWAAFAQRPALLGLALLAWVFGLRHAVDADHIAAIDNSAGRSHRLLSMRHAASRSRASSVPR